MSGSLWLVDLTLLTLTKGSLWLVLALVLARALHRTSAARRHAVWLLALASLWALPMAGAVLPAVEWPWLPGVSSPVGPSLDPQADGADGSSEVVSTAVVSTAVVSTAVASAKVVSTVSPPSENAAWLDVPTAWMGLWVLGCGLLLGRLGVGLLVLQRLRREARVCEHPALPGLLRDLRPQGVAAGRIAVLCHRRVEAPCTWGWWRPEVLLPEQAATWEREQLRDVLAHELAHVARRDWLGYLLANVTCAVCWFHPLAWWASAQLRLEAERACDDRVLSLGTTAPDYAERLVGLARRVHGGRRQALWSAAAMAPTGAALEMARRPQLSQRIAAILNPDLRRHSMTRSFFCIAALLTLALLVLVGPSTLVHAVDEDVVTAATQDLLTAAAEGDSATVQRLVAAGADVNRCLDGQGSPLIQAAYHGRAELVGWLLQAGADANLAETHGPRELPRTPLAAAASSGDVETLRLLLQAGADVDGAPRGDATPLMVAARRGHDAAVQVLLAAGADADAHINGDGTPLIAAAAAGHPVLVQRLLEAGADVDRRVLGDGTPLIAAAGRGHLDVVRLLIDAGADVDRGALGDGTPLLRAAQRGDVEVVRALLDAGADPDKSVLGDGSPLIAASRAGRQDIVQLLVAAGAEVNRGVLGDGNALIRAAGRGDLATVETLLDAGADPNQAVLGDGNALIMAARGGHNEIVAALLQRGADIDAVVAGDENALIRAAGKGHLDTVQLLIDEGADVNLEVVVSRWIVGSETRSPLSMAMRGGHHDVAELLRRHGAGDMGPI